ncbi:hypothetical protein F5883DRAFT_183290 [Diaporthe sp. PMI_573]|nr:hypothetical protein F5883DRAFT_183290 [Diaporthaceae sp. PMI_573]
MAKAIQHARLFQALANSVPSERSFSAANFIHSRSRNRLNQAAVNKLTFIYTNHRTLQQLAIKSNVASEVDQATVKSQRQEMLNLEEHFLEVELPECTWLDLSGHFALTPPANDLGKPVVLYQSGNDGLSERDERQNVQSQRSLSASLARG